MIRAICCLALLSASLSLQSAVAPTVVPGAPPPPPVVDEVAAAAAAVLVFVAVIALELVVDTDVETEAPDALGFMSCGDIKAASTQEKR
jgi:hypothetical protein